MSTALLGLVSTLNMQDVTPANSELQEMRLKTDALVTSFNERYRDTILTPSRSSAPHTPKCKSSSHSKAARVESATIVRFPISSPSGHIVYGTTHPLSHAPIKIASPTSMRMQQAPVAPSASSASSSDFIYFRAMLLQAQAETAQAREALGILEQQLLQSKTQNDELRHAIAIRDGCLEHANSVVAQLQEHKLHLHSIIDNFRAQQASSKAQLDLQARSLINKERHIFSLTEKIQRLQAESTHHQSSCEEALQFMLQECQSTSRERDAALREVVSLRNQLTFSKVLKRVSTVTSVGSATRKALLASVDVGMGRTDEPSVHAVSSTKTVHSIEALSPSLDSRNCEKLNYSGSPARDPVVGFYLAHSHEKQPFAAMFGIQTSPAAALNDLSPDLSKKKLLDLFGEVRSTEKSQEGSESGHSHGINCLAEQEPEERNSQVNNSSLFRSSGSTPTFQQNASASLSRGSLAGKKPRVFANQHRRRSAAARSLASTLAASQHGSDVHSPPATPPLGPAHSIETIGTLDNVRLWAALMAADADTSDS